VNGNKLGSALYRSNDAIHDVEIIIYSVSIVNTSKMKSINSNTLSNYHNKCTRTSIVKKKIEKTYKTLILSADYSKNKKIKTQSGKDCNQSPDSEIPSPCFSARPFAGRARELANIQ
jgi:hypothetical protein